MKNKSKDDNEKVSESKNASCTDYKNDPPNQVSSPFCTQI